MIIISVKKKEELSLKLAELFPSPCVCGENLIYAEVQRDGLDTTPRVRGKLDRMLLTVCQERYNPACAGKTQAQCGIEVRTPIQPRVCGENHYRNQLPRSCIDTTPRVRGKHNLGVYTSVRCGYNPACAGKTIFGSRSAGRFRIQPRVCGENKTGAIWLAALEDTTPRVRGKRFEAPIRQFYTRYNPACAGKTC